MHRAPKLVHGAVALSSTILLALGWVSDRPAAAGASEKSIAGLPARAESGPGAAPQWRTGPKSGPVRGVPVRNFGVVDPGCLYRSAQPGDDADYDWLVKQGFRSVVCLREEPAENDRASRLKAQGLTYLLLPIKNEGAPSEAQANEFLSFVRDPAHWPVLVHCKDGLGRTGVMTALTRYAIDGWPMQRALQEARSYRPFHFPLVGEQRRFLDRWTDHSAAGDHAPTAAIAAPAGAVSTARPN